MKLLSIFFLFCGMTLIPSSGHAAPGDKESSKITFRVLVAGPSGENRSLWLGAGDAPRIEVGLTSNNLSVPYSPAGTQLDFYTDATSDPAVPAVASTTLPDGVGKFILLFVPKEGTSRAYDLKVLVDDTAKLPGAGAVFFNLSSYGVVGTVAETRIQLIPGARQDLKITGLDPESPFRDIDLSYEKNGESNRFFVTRWTFNKDRRFFVFIFWNPKSNSMNLKSIPDLIPEPVPAKG